MIAVAAHFELPMDMRWDMLSFLESSFPAPPSFESENYGPAKAEAESAACR
jgi:hypothetical protein